MATTVDQFIDNTIEDPGTRAPLVTGGLDYNGVTEVVSSLAESPKPPKAWYILFAISSSLLLMLVCLIGHLAFRGVGVWGNNNPVGWALPIVHFEWRPGVQVRPYDCTMYPGQG